MDLSYALDSNTLMGSSENIETAGKLHKNDPLLLGLDHDFRPFEAMAQELGDHLDFKVFLQEASTSFDQTMSEGSDHEFQPNSTLYGVKDRYGNITYQLIEDGEVLLVDSEGDFICGNRSNVHDSADFEEIMTDVEEESFPSVVSESSHNSDMIDPAEQCQLLPGCEKLIKCTLDPDTESESEHIDDAPGEDTKIDVDQTTVKAGKEEKRTDIPVDKRSKTTEGKAKNTAKTGKEPTQVAQPLGQASSFNPVNEDSDSQGYLQNFLQAPFIQLHQFRGLIGLDDSDSDDDDTDDSLDDEASQEPFALTTFRLPPLGASDSLPLRRKAVSLLPPELQPRQNRTTAQTENGETYYPPKTSGTVRYQLPSGSHLAFNGTPRPEVTGHYATMPVTTQIPKRETNGIKVQRPNYMLVRDSDGQAKIIEEPEAIPLQPNRERPESYPNQKLPQDLRVHRPNYLLIRDSDGRSQKIEKPEPLPQPQDNREVRVPQRLHFTTPQQQGNFPVRIRSSLRHTNKLQLNSSGSEDEPSPPGGPWDPAGNTPPPGHMPVPTAAQIQAAFLRARNEPLDGVDLCIGRQQHNAKERARRARIKISCDQLRKLVPGMTGKTDKATVFEFAVHYMGYIKSIIGHRYDNDFLQHVAAFGLMADLDD